MEETIILYAPLPFIFLLRCLKLLLQSKIHPKNLPPSPPSLPVHRFYHRLSKKHDPVFSLYLGSQLFVMVLSSVVAEECFTKNSFSHCSKLITGKHFSCNYTTVSTSSYCCHWRNLRGLGTIEIFSSSRHNAFITIRKDEVLILAGTDTTLVTMEWAMSNLRNHPKRIRCAVLVNAWSIYRDPQPRDDPTSFMPERFEKDHSQSHKMIPFGLGKRAYPGLGLAQ
ncbi:hypothetical protein CXB51_016323 [Gossypium anomalum]|uniref:Uncharacterized protein n=1 Tax=Gossypium anomalum TaxID=47600 RepID=A0A8J5YDS5_9ROSI|nr:hypothetical protein CXB51_016323 [Gossypium anomalum]